MLMLDLSESQYRSRRREAHPLLARLGHDSMTHTRHERMRENASCEQGPLGLSWRTLSREECLGVEPRGNFISLTVRPEPCSASRQLDFTLIALRSGCN